MHHTALYCLALHLSTRCPDAVTLFALCCLGGHESLHSSARLHLFLAQVKSDLQAGRSFKKLRDDVKMMACNLSHGLVTLSDMSSRVFGLQGVI